MPTMESSAHDFKQRQVAGETKRCLEYIKLSNYPTVIILLGETGAGKSSLIESITGASGLSGDALETSTTTCQLAMTSIDGRDYFFIDTPGFEDEPGAMKVLVEILALIDSLANHIHVAGVWYVVDNRAPRVTPIAGPLRTMISAFCGKEFFRYITIVTTHWECSDPRETRELENRLARRRTLWQPLLDGGAKTYQHGKVYENGTETTQTLSWYHAQEELSNQARAMIARGSLPDATPRIIQELRQRTPLERTEAARVFSPSKPALPPTRKGSNECSGAQTGQNESSTKSSAQEEQSKQSSQNQQSPRDQEARPAEGQISSNESSLGFLDILYQGLQLANNLSDIMKGSGLANNFGTDGGLEGLNTKDSLVDFLKHHGQDYDFNARSRMAQGLGLDLNFDGNAHSNNVLLRALRSEVNANGGVWRR